MEDDVVFLHILPTGDKNIVNSFGPKEDPWGTPCFTEVNPEHPVVGSLPFCIYYNALCAIHKVVSYPLQNYTP